MNFLTALEVRSARTYLTCFVHLTLLAVFNKSIVGNFTFLLEYFLLFVRHMSVSQLARTESACLCRPPFRLSIEVRLSKDD